MRLNKTIKTVLPIFVAVIVLFAINPLIVKADKLDVVKTYILTVDANDNLINTARFFYVPDSYTEGVSGHKRIIEPKYIQFTIPDDCRASITYEISNTGNSSGVMDIYVMRAQTDVKSLVDMYPGDYMLGNVAGEMAINNITVTLKTTCYYDEYKEAVSKGENWTLVGGDVVAECTCKTKCIKEAVNGECHVCKTDYTKCTCTENATSNTGNTDATKTAEEQKKAEETKKLEEQKKTAEASTNNITTADSGVATTASSDPNVAFTPEELALAQGQASQIIADAQLEAQSIIETANEQAETRLSEANEQAAQILLDAGIAVGQHKDTMPLGGMIALIILIIAVIGEGGVIAYTLLKDKLE